MRGNAHVRFGGRPGETDRPKDRHRAPGPPNVFRFNRRRSRSRGLLFHRLLTQAAASDTLTYDQLRKAGRTRSAPPLPPAARALPRSLDLGHVGLPWRSSDRA